MTDLIDTTEMYLRTIYELEEEGIVPLRARIAERLGHSGPTVSQTVARMERDALLSVSGDRHLELSETGRAIATAVMRKHRLAERLLVDVIGLEWELAHDEACRWEHVVSDRVEQRILTLLGDRAESPYGTPIPALADIGGPEAEPFLAGSVASLVSVLPDEPGAGDAGGSDSDSGEGSGSGSGSGHRTGVGADAQVVLRRIGEPAQGDLELLALFASLGLRPGARMTARRSAGEVLVTTPAGSAALAETLAAHIFVEPATAVG